MVSFRSYQDAITRSYNLVRRSSPRWTSVNIILVFLLGILPIIALYLTKMIIDIVTVSFTDPNKTIYIQQLTLTILAAGIVGIVLVLSRSLSDLARRAQSIEVTDAVYDILHAKSIAVDLEHYDDSGYQDLLHRAQKEAPYRPTEIVYSLVQIGQNSISLIGIAWLIISFNAWLGLILSVVAFPAAFVRMKYSQKLFHFFAQRAESERRASYYHTILTDPTHAKEIRIFNIGSFFKERFKSTRSELRQKEIQIACKRFSKDFLAQSLATCILFITLGYVAYQAVLGDLTIGDMVVYYMAFQSGLMFLQAMLYGVASLYENQLFLNNLYVFLAIESKIKGPKHPRSVPGSFQNGVTFHDITYTYLGNSSPSLQNLSFSLGPNEVIAIVGENGSGKTSIVKLLCRLYEPETGSISVDGIDIREFDPVQWRNRISVIFQDYMKYQMTVWENIWMSGIETEPDRELIVEAAQLAGADSVIRRLPNGYDTTLGRWFEDGNELSEGEWQRIALARAFYRDAAIIVLDEPSASLDTHAEAKLFREFRKIIQERSAIIISHRFSNVRIADRILVMDKGKIIEEGTHDELIAQNGMYASLFKEQSRMYRESLSDDDSQHGSSLS